MSKHRKITELTIVNSLKNLSPKQQQLFVGFMRYIALPMVLIAWLHFFEMHTYAWDPFDIMNFGMLISTSITLYYLLLFVYHTAPMWQLQVLKWILYSLLGFIFFGFVYKYMERDREYYSIEDTDYLREKIKENEKIDADYNIKFMFKNDKYILYGKENNRTQSLYFAGSKREKLTFDQQFAIYEKELLPSDFRKYWELIDISGNDTSENIIIDYLGWRYPNYLPYIYIYIYI